VLILQKSTYFLPSSFTRRRLSNAGKEQLHNVLSSWCDFRILADKNCRVIKTYFVFFLESQTVIGIVSKTFHQNCEVTKLRFLCENLAALNRKWKQRNCDSPRSLIVWPSLYITTSRRAYPSLTGITYTMVFYLLHLPVSMPCSGCRLARHLQASCKAQAHAAQSSRSNNHTAQQLCYMCLAFWGSENAMQN